MIMKILYVSYFRTIKGPETLVKAMQYLKDLDIETTMLSTGPILDMCKRLAKKLDVKINFTGFVDEKTLSKYYSEADVIVFPYGSGVTLVEAMMAGKAIITYDRSWARGFSTHMKDAIIVYEREPRAFADAIKKLYYDESLRKTLAKNALEKTKKMKWKPVADQVGESFELAIKRKGGNIVK